MEEPLIIQIHPILRKYDPELFYLENVNQNVIAIKQNRLEFDKVLQIIEDTMPDQIKLKCHDLWSGTVAEFVHELYTRLYFIKETSEYYGKNSKRNSDYIEFLFIKTS